MSLPADAFQASYDDATGRSLKERALALMTETSPEIAEQPLDSWLNERISATDRMLAHITEDPDALPPIADWIKPLTLRFLAASVGDPDFFRRSGHPLLQLVNQLDQLASFLPSKGKQLETAIETMLPEILSADARDPDAFDAFTQRLDGLRQRYSGQYQRQVARTIEKFEAQERVRQAHLKVQDEIDRMLAGKKVHRTVLKLIDSAWKKLLELHYLREGEQGGQWVLSWRTLKRLHVLCGGETDQDEAVIPDWASTIADVHEGLLYVGIDSFQCKALEEPLALAARQVRDKCLSDAELLLYLPHKPSGSDAAADAQAMGIEREDWRRALSLVDSLEVGSDFRFKEQGQQRRLQLVWKNADSTEFVFVDAQGNPVRSMTRVELALSLHQGQSKVAMPVASKIADRAMDATLKEMQERVDYHQTHDALTGLNNRPQFLGKLTRLLAEVGSSQAHLLGFLEIDRFDAITSTCGYIAGEKLLQAVARLLENRFEDTASLAFLGSRRFGFVAPWPTDVEEKAVGEQVLSDLATNPFYWQGVRYSLSGSVGLVVVDLETEDPESLLSAADMACASAYEAGGNRVVMFREDDDVIAQKKDQMGWLIKTEEVIKAKRIRLRGQRITPMNADSGRLPHYEILLSVFDEQGTPLNLEEFIATAEAFNLMAEVDRLVIAHALIWVHEHPARAKALGGIAINLSGKSLADANLVDYIQELIETLEIPPELISFEVTETAAITSLDKAVRIIEGIKRIGCAIALDDFGTGLSSYTYLKQLPVDYLKIDGSFIKGILNNPHDLAIVKSINEIAHFMGKQTIAEYVESQRIMERLNEIGIDFGQGYAIEKPLFLDEMQ
jgi:diguanylate cyclase (GGDEF)-like protein